ncbi:hypothetical protein NBRC110019_16520 [Neptunitalea chrysea]|uniref:Uncharacterized protein n=2 Tax=Neptunitalea chrysea TaxID=1647581 RepID=A0A9W6EVK5_9FLAO|nr:hypothetical protein NBRC110019_16520 [Neptunitalea chrysea]
MAQFMFSQEEKDDKEIVKDAFVAYDGYVAKKDFENAANAIVPSFFESMPKDQYLKMMGEIYENPGMNITIHPAEDIVIGDIQEVGEMYYATITYSCMKDIEYHAKKGDSPEKSRTKLSTVKIFFKDTYGAENVMFNEEASQFEIKTSNEAYAVSSNKINWKFLAVDLDGMERIYGKILPEEYYTVPIVEE